MNREMEFFIAALICIVLVFGTTFTCSGKEPVPMDAPIKPPPIKKLAMKRHTTAAPVKVTPIKNQVGECPPMEGDFKCPMEVQETDAPAFKGGK